MLHIQALQSIQFSTNVPFQQVHCEISSKEWDTVPQALFHAIFMYLYLWAISFRGIILKQMCIFTYIYLWIPSNVYLFHQTWAIKGTRSNVGSIYSLEFQPAMMQNGAGAILKQKKEDGISSPTFYRIPLWLMLFPQKWKDMILDLILTACPMWEIFRVGIEFSFWKYYAMRKTQLYRASWRAQIMETA